MQDVVELRSEEHEEPKTYHITVTDATSGEKLLDFNSNIVVFGGVVKDEVDPETNTAPVNILHIGTPAELIQMLTQLNNNVTKYLVEVGKFHDAVAKKQAEKQSGKDIKND